MDSRRPSDARKPSARVALVHAYRSGDAQIRSLELAEIFSRQKYENAEQNHRHDIRPHTDISVDSGARLFKF
jgi:hypothetical protein